MLLHLLLLAATNGITIAVAVVAGGKDLGCGSCLGPCPRLERLDLDRRHSRLLRAMRVPLCLGLELPLQVIQDLSQGALVPGAYERNNTGINTIIICLSDIISEDESSQHAPSNKQPARLLLDPAGLGICPRDERALNVLL